MTDFQVNGDQEQVIVVLRGDLTVERAGELKQTLQNAIAAFKSIIIGFEDNLTIDVSFLQLICSAHRSALNFQKDLKLAGAVPEDFTRAIQSVGFTFHAACALNKNRECLMCSGGEHE